MRKSRTLLQSRVRKSATLQSSPPTSAGASPGASNASGGALCGNPGRPKNGRSLYASQHERAIVTHTCDPGHTLVGAGHRVCQQNGMWAPNLPKCLRKLYTHVCVHEGIFQLFLSFFLFSVVDCRDPGVPANGFKWLVNTFLGSVVTYSCNVGFALTGDAQRVCQVSGNWSGSLPTCVSKINHPLSLISLISLPLSLMRQWMSQPSVHPEWSCDHSGWQERLHGEVQLQERVRTGWAGHESVRQKRWSVVGSGTHLQQR